MKIVFYFAACLWTASCGMGTGPEPKLAETKTSTVNEEQTVNESFTEPKLSGRGFRYQFVYSDAKADITFCTDKSRVRVDELWEKKESIDRSSGPRSLKMIFDSENKSLTVINNDKNTYKIINEKHMAKAVEDLQNNKPMSLGSSLAIVKEPKEPVLIPLSSASVPLPAKEIKKKHPDGCAVFERELLGGLKEEICFLPDNGDIPASEDYLAMVSMARFIEELSGRVRELEVVFATAGALEWDLGVPAAEFKFGDMIFEEESNTMKAWDRTYTLKERFPCSISDTDIEPPNDAIEEYGILPWSTPFISTALP